MHCSRRLCTSRTATLCHISARPCDIRKVMRVLPQPVVVVTSSMVHADYGLVKKGVTCSSFTSLTLDPPTVLISIYKGNAINKFIESSGHFATNILSHKQIKAGIHFAKSLSDDLQHDQFKDIEHEEGIKGMPLLTDCSGIVQCVVSKSNIIGDHQVWYGTALEADTNTDTSLQPMLYYQRSFRTIGDEIFMQAFEETTLPFEVWTHEAHLRMAWNYIIQYGSEVATPLIKQGIMNFNEQNKEKITTGYHETITMFYIGVITEAILSMPAGHSFDEFLRCHNELTNKNYLQKFYSPEILASSESKHTFLGPDRQRIPS